MASSHSSSDSSGATPGIWSWRQKRLEDSPDASDPLYASLHDLHSSALQAAETPRLARSIMLGSLIGLSLFVVALIYTPWLQTVSGSGTVTSFSPNARPQSIESQISARIQEWNVVEGDMVAAGDTIAILEDIKTEYMDNRFVERISEARISELRVLQLEEERARRKLNQAQQKLRSARAKLENASLEVTTVRRQFQRVRTLYDDGLTSLRDFEDEELKLQKARADSVSAAADRASAAEEVESARLEVDRKTSSLEKRRSELNLKLDNAQERQSASIIRAPIDGIISRVSKAGPGQTVKEGDRLAEIVPETDDQAVELFVSSVDAAIVEPGRRVQLQFAGFPALQFAGFPGVSVGIFTGKVRVIDPVDDGGGRYRLLVVPDTTGGHPPWPGRSYLRQGSSATGWVMLSNVSLGYEIWRRMNSLPPEIPVRESTPKRKPK